ncbi:hypothetical protein HMN09_00487000 [Mycena chlorophos]|uniref:Uncharacterized protein n=1 Tax=Mycena chlorophos TaxID=658473 RepID=A0A8H6TAS8_MYCCL|nr:hypothetical protein HMN09_00487000 [Mycena chlorophos]
MVALWRDAQQPLSADEPPHLAKFISEFPPDGAPAAAAPIRYIDLEKHPLLAATHNVRTVQRDWREKAVFLVRDEYRELLKAALESPPANLLVTGHSRIGKGFACAFLILVLLAAGQPFFYIEHTSTIHHFSTHGVQCGNPTNVWDLDEGEAADQLLRASWLLIDVGQGWEIPPAFLFTKFALCTSPEDGMRYYVKEFKALYWHMRPWSRTEALSVAAPIRYINLDKNPLLCATHKVQAMRSAWGEKAIFLVRDEYRELLKTALDSQATNLRQKANLLVTGQPGIGLSFACTYLILFLLASGQPFFFIGHRTTMYHFSEHGVQFGDPANRVIDTLGGREATTGLLHTSWLLVDVEPNARWGIPPAFINTKLALWTSSPGDGLRPYVKEFKAVHWYMQPWPGAETLSVARHFGIPDDECFKLISAFGPIPRDIFFTPHPL